MTAVSVDRSRQQKAGAATGALPETRERKSGGRKRGAKWPKRNGKGKRRRESGAREAGAVQAQSAVTTTTAIEEAGRPTIVDANHPGHKKQPAPKITVKRR